MAISNLLLNHFIGGAMKNQNSGKNNYVTVFLTLLVIFLINALLVMWSYNLIVPKIAGSMSSTPQVTYNNVSQASLNYGDAVVLLILFQTLFA